MSTTDPTRVDPVDGSSPLVEAALDQTFDNTGLIALRSAVAAHAAELGLAAARRDELILLAHELASNAVVHGGGQGRLRLWAVDGRLYCEVSDGGPGLPPGLLSGGQQPPLGATGGRGLWLVRVLADDLDVRSGPEGSTITAMVQPTPDA